LVVETLAEPYSEQQAQHIRDATWIHDATCDGLVLLHADKRIRYQPLEKAAMLEAGARSFALSTNNLSGEAIVHRYLRFREQMEEIINRRQGPYCYLLYPDKMDSRPLTSDRRDK
jgi:hypothetical protein